MPRQQLIIIMTGGHPLVQSKPLPPADIEDLINTIDAGLEPNDRASKLMLVPSTKPEFVVIPNIATCYIEDVADEDDEDMSQVPKTGDTPPF